MAEELTLGSLFSGSGGFELAGAIFGIKPIWNAEIEKIPCAVTARNFPATIQLGDVTRINGAQIPKVDIITGGSPCQDMSIAGTRAGLQGDRSSLFREQIRIVKEMREDDKNAGRTGKDIRCRWMVWENVPGAFTSNSKRDFQAVLTEIVRIAEPEAPLVPIPQKGWPSAGCLMGEHGEWSVAYRTLDAKFWGVPQRRKRIYLVADFAGPSGPEILFERQGLSRNFKESRQAWETDTPHTAPGAGTSSRDNRGGGQLGTSYTLLIRSGCEGGGKGALVQTESSATLSTHNTQTLFEPVVLDNHPQDSRITVLEDGISPTLTEKMGTGGNNVPMIMEPIFSPIPINDKATRYKGGGTARHGDGSGNGLGIGQLGDPAPTLTASDRHGVAYGISRDFYNQGVNAKFDPEITEELSATVTASPPPPAVAYPEIAGTLTAKMAKGTGGPAGDEMQNLVAEWPEYIVRRFTPLECGRLQGFPDWWTEGIKASDTALYKMWGNGIALPCAMYVMEGIAIKRKEM